jgi:hypothetical protein
MGKPGYSRSVSARLTHLCVPYKCLYGELESARADFSNWCGRGDSNSQSQLATTTSTLRVYQFRHDRKLWCRRGDSNPYVVKWTRGPEPRASAIPPLRHFSNLAESKGFEPLTPSGVISLRTRCLVQFSQLSELLAVRARFGLATPCGAPAFQAGGFSRSPISPLAEGDGVEPSSFRSDSLQTSVGTSPRALC